MNSKHTSTLAIGITFVAGLGLGEACKSTKINENHCSFLDGDETCRSRHADEGLVYCGGDCVDTEYKDGCVAEIPPDTRAGYGSLYTPG